MCCVVRLHNDSLQLHFEYSLFTINQLHPLYNKGQTFSYRLTAIWPLTLALSSAMFTFCLEKNDELYNIPGLIQTLKYYNPVFSKISSVWILDKLRGWTWNNYISALLHATWYIHVLHFHKQHPGFSVARKITLSDWRKICAVRRLTILPLKHVLFVFPGKYEFPFSSKLCIQPFFFFSFFGKVKGTVHDEKLREKNTISSYRLTYSESHRQMSRLRIIS